MLSSLSHPLEAGAADPRPLSKLRRNLLRAPYAVIAVGLGAYVWPSVLRHTDGFAAQAGEPMSLLAGLGATAVLGVRYPVRMLPLLIFEFVWKAIYLSAFALPLWLAGRLDAASAQTAGACLMVLAFVPFTPWRYVFSEYVLRRGEAWR